jgi:FtsZ-interacting cell division protein ZipA
MQALSALTPPLLVCAVVVIAIVAFLRHEMSRSRADRSTTGEEGEIQAAPSEADPDKQQGKLSDAARADATRASADENGSSTSRR